MVLSFLHGPIRIPMVFILQQDRDRRPRLHHIQRLRRYENWLSCRRLSRRRLSFRQRRGSFPFRRLLYHRPLFLQLSYHQPCPSSFHLRPANPLYQAYPPVLLHWQELPGRLQSMRLGARFLERSYLQGPGHRCCCRPEWSLGLL